MSETECRDSFEREFVVQTEPSVWSEETKNNRELMYQIYRRGWFACHMYRQIQSM